MHYYNHNIADYRKDTGWLCLLQHGIYRQLLDTYYLDEKPLPDDIQKLSLIICARNKKEVDAMKQVLEFFFDKTDVGFTHKRCEEEINIFHAKKEKKRTAANSRWSKLEAVEDKGNVLSFDDANDMHMHSTCNADGMLTNNHKPITNNQEPITNKETIKKEKKETVSPSGFTDFWSLYPAHPRKGGKDKCLKIWTTRKLESQAQQILTHLAWQKKDWARSNNEYVQMPQSYLNAAKWDGWIDSGEQRRERGLVV